MTISIINTTDWSHLHHAHGTCEHVPGALRELCSGDARVAEAAYWKLDNYVVVQGDLYEAAPFVVRALNELLRQPLENRERPYELLVELAYGDAPETMTVNIGDRAVPIKTATDEALLEGVDVYRVDLGAGNVAVRRLCAQLLVALSSRAPLDLSELREIALRESDPVTGAILDELLTLVRC